MFAAGNRLLMFTLLKSLPTLSTLELSRLERALAVERQHRAGLWSLPDDLLGCIVQHLPDDFSKAHLVSALCRPRDHWLWGVHRACTARIALVREIFRLVELCLFSCRYSPVTRFFV